MSHPLYYIERDAAGWPVRLVLGRSPQPDPPEAPARQQRAQEAIPADPPFQPLLNFDGDTFDAVQDRDRLGAQLEAVKALMLDGEWRTLSGISSILLYPEASVSARLRDLRKERFGGYTVERRRANSRGLYEYRLGGKA